MQKNSTRKIGYRDKEVTLFRMPNDNQRRRGKLKKFKGDLPPGFKLSHAYMGKTTIAIISTPQQIKAAAKRKRELEDAQLNKIYPVAVRNLPKRNGDYFFRHKLGLHSNA